MKKRYWWGLLVLGLLIIGGVVGVMNHRTNTASAPATTPKAAKKATTKPLQPITKKTWQQHPKLRYASIIYYAVKHLKIQRWQEVSDFNRGWQVEIYPNHGQPKYLVWPDKNIKDEAKQLQPNWFTISSAGTVTYDSFGVHTFAKDQTAKISEARILEQTQADHATKKIYAMLDNLIIVKHH
ncbi:hypothetical protein D1831_09615 [Lactiplantibacillus garii]|uniref:Uncharacterized protein n=1 Tax=Lactiplantibacillus garii TaxID=2306423 RepID=A0A426D5S8_9LACO|nr:hypothetical protein [Lactiplantibacillus garii]RRK10007.1 hypothetical protein D1831_09615 [Lactiplantibacillus garii]